MGNIYLPGMNSISNVHTIGEFIQMRYYNTVKNYHDFSFIETQDGKEIVIRQVLDDYLDDMKEQAVKVKFTDLEISKYKYNPKMLSYDIYKSTVFYYVILRLNNMCNVHLFDLANKTLYLLPPPAMSNFITKIYSVENIAISKYNNYHNNDTATVVIDKTR